MKYYLVLATVLAVCSWVASDNNYVNTLTELVQQCLSRVGANDSDVEELAPYQPLETEDQRKLALCFIELIRNISGVVMNDIADEYWVYTRVYDGDLSKFINATEKVQECYNAAKELDGEDQIYALQDCYRKV